MQIKQNILQNLWQYKIKLLVPLAITALIIVMMVDAMTSDMASNQKTYVDYATLAKYETAYIGDNSKVGNLYHQLPMLDNYNNSWFALDTTTHPYRMRIYYDQFNMDQSWIPYAQFTKDSNALFLFRYIHNLDQISLNFYSGDELVPREQRDYEEHDHYQRADFEAKYGDLNQLTATDLEQIFRAERAIDDSAHYNRVRWGSPAGWVTYRNGEADRVTEYPNGSLELDYYNLGHEENGVHFYLDHPNCIAKDLDGVYQIHVNGWESEISWHCDITSNSEQAMLERLGEPQICRKEQDGSYRYFYPVYGEKGQKYIYFDCQEGQIIAHGLGYGLGFEQLQF